MDYVQLISMCWRLGTDLYVLKFTRAYICSPDTLEERNTTLRIENASSIRGLVPEQYALIQPSSRHQPALSHGMLNNNADNEAPVKALSIDTGSSHGRSLAAGRYHYGAGHAL